MELLTQYWAALETPLGFVLDPGKRVFHVFLASSLGLAVLVYLFRRPAHTLWSYLFSRDIWLSRSAVLDYKLVFANAFVRPLAAVPYAASVVVIVAMVSTGLQLALGPAAVSAWSRTTISVVFTVCLFVFGDFTRYVLHRWLHSVPALWELHKVHHSAEVLTPVTVYRTHPIENLLYSIRHTLSAGVVTGVFFYFFQHSAVEVELIGINVFGFLFNVLGSNLRHSHVWLSFGPRIERWFISPAQHQIHHSKSSSHHGKNLGSYLAIWDRLGGTLYTTSSAQESIEFGLDDADANHAQALGSAWTGPLKAAWATIARRKTTA